MSNQHGFRKDHSCEKQLLELVTEVSSSLDAGREPEVCILDFSKAFNKVNYHKLITKLADHGMCYQLEAWIENFLADRKQKVVVEGEWSDEVGIYIGAHSVSILH